MADKPGSSLQLLGLVFGGIGAFAVGASWNPVSYLGTDLGDTFQRGLSGLVLCAAAGLTVLIVCRIRARRRFDHPTRAGRDYCEGLKLTLNRIMQQWEATIAFALDREDMRDRTLEMLRRVVADN